ncbi:integrase [Salmonella enterica]|nr:integrase [Salmonella enterica]
MSGRRSAIPADSLLQLRQRLDRLPPKSPERAAQIAAAAQLYGISVTTVYRALRLVLQATNSSPPRSSSAPDTSPV